MPVFWGRTEKLADKKFSVVGKDDVAAAVKEDLTEFLSRLTD